MLYNKNWDAKTVTSDPFSLESLIAWLEKQPAEKKYDWSSADECLLGQWCKFNGLKGAAAREKSLVLGAPVNFLEPIYQTALGSLHECTFGAALTRARAALAAS